MRNKKGTICLLAGCMLLPAASRAATEEPVYYQPFDRVPEHVIRMAAEATTGSPSYFLVHTPTYSAGLEGLALDLTDDVAFRIPLNLTTDERPGYGADDSFAFEVWVQTKPGAAQGTPILTNQATADPSAPGWCIGTHENGAWYWHMGDGKTSYDYEPTPQRQAVNDGKWHQLAVSYDRGREETRMYFDGRNVAVYHTPGLGSMESKLRTVVGGSDENQDWECRGEWMAFNGKIDEVKLWECPLGAGEVKSAYTRHFPFAEPAADVTPQVLKAQVWNIWHGGRRFGRTVGVQRVVDVLKQENADVIGLIETYGSGAVIADSLGYYFYLISSNLSILSRYPIEETVRVFRPFNSGGAVIRLSDTQRIAFFNCWLHYLPDVTELGKGKAAVKQYEQEEAKTRVAEIEEILKELAPYTAAASETPVLLAGDFNCASQADWTEQTKGLHGGVTVLLPVSERVTAAGFHDSFRQLTPDVSLAPGATWSPLINAGADKLSCLPQRIDFIYYQGEKLVPFRSETLTHYPKGWPSDHGSVVTSFYVR